MKFHATKETMDKVLSLEGKNLYKGNEEGQIFYKLKVRPFERFIDEGDIIIIASTDRKREYSYCGEEGLQQLLKEWKEK